MGNKNATHKKRENQTVFHLFILLYWCRLKKPQVVNRKWWRFSIWMYFRSDISIQTKQKNNRKKTHSNHFRVNKLIFNEAKTIQISAIQFNRSLLSGKQHFCWGWRIRKKKPFDSNYDIRFVFKYFVKLNTYFMVNSIPNWITYRADSIGISGAHHWDALIRYQ